MSRCSSSDMTGGGSWSPATSSCEVAVQVRRDLPRPLVSVAGELDLDSARLLTAMLDHVRRSWVRHARERSGPYDVDIDVDLTRVTFADSSGLAPVLEGRTRIVAASPPVRRVLRLLIDPQGADQPPAVSHAS
jgi:anti-anti-sigma regulatory factor